MVKAIDLNNAESLKFIGKVNASISHELKNILAVISETAGFLGDLTESAKRGRPLEFETLSSCSDAIVKEVQRGFAAIRQMNKFAHSVDDPVKRTGLADVVELMVELSKFLSYAGKIRFDRANGAEIEVFTSPFLLQDVVYRTLLTAFRAVGPEGEFGISVEPWEKGGGIVRFSGIRTNDDRYSEEEAIREAADSIGVETLFNPASGTIELFVPETMEHN
jgi:C4-dicarboxylate-specific signal transduction histidine kinase